MDNNREDNLESKISSIDEKINKFKNPELQAPKKKTMGAEKLLAELVAGILFGVFVGGWLDDYFDTKPVFLLTLIILGLAGSFYSIYKEAVKNEKD